MSEASDDRGLGSDGRIRRGGSLARAPAGDAAIVSDLIGGLGGWLAREYGRTVGVKAS
jgi:hypothetical protein